MTPKTKPGWSLRSTPNADWPRLAAYAAAKLAGAFHAAFRLPPRSPRDPLAPAEPLPSGVTVVIPSRTGRALLEAQLPALLAQAPEQVVIVDNGSTDDSAAWLAAAYPQIEVVHSPAPLSFARAVNRGIARAHYSHICLLNNDMLLEPGFFASLSQAFQQVPDLFSATAQIHFPPGMRREETGKTVFAQDRPEDFPIRCDLPLPGEDGSYVLYGSGGCTLYDAAKLRALGGVDEIYEPAYVEDLDLGYRAWQKGWPNIYVAGAAVEHRHRATTTRYYSEAELDRILERNYLRFVARAPATPAIFRRLWEQALRRLLLQRGTPQSGTLQEAAALVLQTDLPRGAAPPAFPEELFLALTGGSVSVFPGRPAHNPKRVLLASSYVPFPLLHEGAERMYRLMLLAAAEFDLVLVSFTENAAPPPAELLAICTEVVLVHRPGSEETESPAFRAALRLTVAKWRPAVAQLESVHLAHYAADCSPARTVPMNPDPTTARHRP